jgi:glycosyltransferase involved in cell wall biosynthesis
MAPGLTHDMAQLRRAGFINHCAHDDDCARSRLKYLNLRDRWWHERALRGADALLAQTEWQRESLRSEFGLASEVLPNLVENRSHAVDPGQDGAVVWLGTYKGVKRPDWFVRLAAEIPERRFVMVGVIPPPPLAQDSWELARAAAAKRPNLEVRGFLEHSQVAKLLEGASLLVHTSAAEGFSNVLLEAWAHGLPTVSCVNPDGLITREGLGDSATEYEGLVKSVRALLADPEARRAAGRRARAYTLARHDPKVVIDQLAGIVDRVVERVRARRARRAPHRES